MKLDRNINGDGHGKYGIVKNRALQCAKDVHSPQGLMEIEYAVKVLEAAGVIEWGDTPETEFFVIRLRDRYATVALQSYASMAYIDDAEYAKEIVDLSNRSGRYHPLCKKPD